MFLSLSGGAAKNCVLEFLDGEIQENSPIEELARVATLLKEKESAEEDISTLQLPEKRPSPLSHNIDIIWRKYCKATCKSSCYHGKEKGSYKISGSGANPLVRKIYEKLAARCTSEAFTPPSLDCITNKTLQILVYQVLETST